MDEEESPQFQRSQKLCQNTAVDFNSQPVIDETFFQNVTETLTSPKNFPVDLSDSLTFGFAIPNSELFLDPLSLNMHLRLSIRLKDDKKLTDTQYSAFICGILFTMFKKIEIWANGTIVKVYGMN
jgi:hypothetical protein